MNRQLFVDEYESAKRKLYFVALSVLKSPQDAEDAVQEAAMRAYQKITSLKNIDYFNTWITRIILNICFDKKKKPVETSIDIINPEELSYMDKHEIIFFDLVSCLPDKDKKVVVLRYFYQASFNDISKTLRLPLSTVKSRLYRSLEKIKESMGDYL